MDVEHDDPDLSVLETDPSLDARHPKGVARKYRWVMQQIRLAVRKNQLYQIGSLQLKKLEGSDDEAMWINKKYRLEMVFLGTPPDERVRILRISNHYGD